MSTQTSHQPLASGGKMGIIIGSVILGVIVLSGIVVAIYFATLAPSVTDSGTDSTDSTSDTLANFDFATTVWVTATNDDTTSDADGSGTSGEYTIAETSSLTTITLDGTTISADDILHAWVLPDDGSVSRNLLLITNSYVDNDDPWLWAISNSSGRVRLFITGTSLNILDSSYATSWTYDSVGSGGTFTVIVTNSEPEGDTTVVSDTTTADDDPPIVLTDYARRWR